jgi:hypothetical protein
MISGIVGSEGVIVSAGHTSLPHVAQGTADNFNGLIRISGTGLQYYNSGSWSNLPVSYATVKLDQETQDLLQWAQQKKKEDEAMWAAPDDHPAIIAAKQYFNKAKAEMMKAEQQLKATVILSKDYEKSTS